MVDTEVPLAYLDYTIDKTDFIRQALAGYTGGSTIASEMLQNADDAGARHVEFHFRPDALVVKNDQTFQNRDFNHIMRIASGGKRREASKIGTWGTGFLSVFHVTDAPELQSAGKRIVFDPTRDKLPYFGSPVEQETIFTLPWRRDPTVLSSAIEAKIWTEEDIQEFRDDLVSEIYRLILFLRHVEVVEIYESADEPRRICCIERRLIETVPLTRAIRQVWAITYQRAGRQPYTDRWLYYRGDAPSLPLGGVTVKDAEIALAFSMESRDWLVEHVPASLYNFLPTPIRTGLPFQINGAFFPDNNRHNILLDQATQPEKSKWNQHVLETLGDLFIHVMLDLRYQAPEKRRFYEWLPIGTQAPGGPYAAPIHKTFLAAAPHQPIIFSSLRQWVRPDEIYFGRVGSRLPELAEDYLDIVPTGMPQALRDQLSSLGARELTATIVLDYLHSHLRPGEILVQAHQMINTREKLERLYAELERDRRTPNLADRPLGLGTDGTLRAFSMLWAADASTRNLLADLNLPFVDASLQKQFPNLIGSLVPEFRGRDLVAHLAGQSWPEIPSPLAEAHPLLATRDRLIAVLHFIAQDLEEIDPALLASVPLVLSTRQQLYRASDSICRCASPDEQKVAHLAGLAPVDDDLVEDPRTWAVYRHAGIRSMTAERVLTALERDLPAWQTLPVDHLVQSLLLLYAYCEAKVQPGSADADRLRALPLCLTQEGQLRAVNGPGPSLYLPPHDSTDLQADSIRPHLDKLRVDYLAHSVLAANGSHFLTRYLGMQMLTPVQLIRKVIAPRYLDSKLDDNARRDLLRYIDVHLRKAADANPTGQMQMLTDLRPLPLIQCADGQYRPANKVYFRFPALDEIFGSGYPQLHPAYQVPTTQPDDANQIPYKDHPLYWLFSKLGVNERPSSTDLVAVIRQIAAAGAPTDERIDQVRRLYRFLNAEVGRIYKVDDADLRQLRGFAWLPVRNPPGKWLLPSEIYAARFHDMTGDHVPLLRFEEPTALLRELLGIPAEPPVEAVLAHLRDSARRNQAVSPHIYEFLGRKATPEHIAGLKGEAIIWDNGRKRYWRPDQVYLGDWHRQFGVWRGYLTPPGGEVQTFLAQLGVKDRPDELTDPLTLLREIADDYRDGRPLDPDDRNLLLFNFDHLGRLLADGLEPQELNPISRLPIVPGTDGRLHLPQRIVFADRREILDHFNPDSIPTVDEGGSRWQLNQAAVDFLTSIGVKALSAVVIRQQTTADGRFDVDATEHLRGLHNAIERVALKVAQQRGKKIAMDQLRQLTTIEVFQCKRLRVRYVLEHMDWRLEGYEAEEAAVYDLTHNRLYVRQSVDRASAQEDVALELDQVLFPGETQSTTLERLLTLRSTEVDIYLDKHKYPRLRPQELELEETDSPVAAVANWALDEPISPDEPPEEVEEDPLRWPRLQVDSQPIQAVSHSFQRPNGPPAIWDPQPDFRQGKLWPVTPREPEAPTDRTHTPDPSLVAPTASQSSTAPGDGLTSFGGHDGETTIEQPDTPLPAEVPIFTGQQRLPVPVLPNNWGRLEQQYGLRLYAKPYAQVPDRTPVGGVLNEDVSPAARHTTGMQMSEVRFTLRFAERYQGFLPLTRRARQMLNDRPRQLRCETDYEAWVFDLYVDYEQGVIYNQELLPAFFDAYGIPAGGIVYLERVHGAAVRLYWNALSNRIDNVQCLELQEDGTVQVHEIPSAEFLCELDEYVLRTEKRFEDPLALFHQALDAAGLFATLCDVFGGANTELSYDAIVKGVWVRRWVAIASIAYQLTQRPCFVPLDGNRWRFEPERGALPAVLPSEQAPPAQADRYDLRHDAPTRSYGTRKGMARESRPAPRQSSNQSAGTGVRSNPPGNLPTVRRAPVTPYEQELERIREESETWKVWFEAEGADAFVYLQRLAARFVVLGQQLREKLNKLADDPADTNHPLSVLWYAVAGRAHDRTAREALVDYLNHEIRESGLEVLLKQIAIRVADTRQTQREHVFFPLLAEWARNLIAEQPPEQTRRLFAFLQAEGAGEFKEEFRRIETRENVQAYLALSAATTNRQERWEWWRDAWDTYPGEALLQQAIVGDLQKDLTDLEREVATYLACHDSDGARGAYQQWLALVNPLSGAWHAAAVAGQIWLLGSQIFDQLVESHGMKLTKAQAREALRFAAVLPSTASYNPDLYLQAVHAVAAAYAHSEPLLVGSLIDYAVYRLLQTGVVPQGERAGRVHELASRCYEQLDLFDRAYNHLARAAQLVPQAWLTEISQRRAGLMRMREQPVAHRLVWADLARSLQTNPAFTELVDTSMFSQLLREWPYEARVRPGAR